MNKTTSSRIDITISDARDRDNQLSDAVNRLIPVALENRHGILVTQHNASAYTLEVHSSTPVGTIREKRPEEY